MANQLTMEGFLSPKNPARKRKHSMEGNPVAAEKNRYASLKEVILPSTSPKKSRVPPIFVKAASHAENMTFFKAISPNFSLKYCGNGKLRVQANNSDTFGLFIDGLKKAKTQYYTYTLPGTAPKKAVIKGLPIIPVDAILEDLLNQGVKALSVSSFKGKNGAPLKFPIYLVNVDPSSDMNLMKNIKVICSCRISVEKYFGKKTAQCFRCQSFGHVSKNCNMKPKCVKCGDMHPTSECIKELSTPATCANCKKDHPANFSGCSARVIYEKKLASKKSPVNNNRSWAQVAGGLRQVVQAVPATFAAPAPAPAPIPPPMTRLYSAALKGTPITNNQTTDQVTSVDASSHNLTPDALFRLVLQVNSLHNRLKSCNNKDLRMQLVMQLALSLDSV